MSRYHCIDIDTLTKNKLKTTIDKLPASRYDMGTVIDVFFNKKGTPAYLEGITEIKKILQAQKKIFSKTGAMLVLEDCVDYIDTFDTYKDVKTGAISYKVAFLIAFEMAALQYLWDTKDANSHDEATIALIYRTDEIAYLPDSKDASTFLELVDIMVGNLRGDFDYDEDDMDECALYDNLGMRAVSDTYLLYLLLPRMDSKFTTLHKELFNALVTWDVAAVNEIIKVK